MPELDILWQSLEKLAFETISNVGCDVMVLASHKIFTAGLFIIFVIEAVGPDSIIVNHAVSEYHQGPLIECFVFQHPIHFMESKALFALEKVHGL
jgi:hypothetical protein